MTNVATNLTFYSGTCVFLHLQRIPLKYNLNYSLSFIIRSATDICMVK